jgi:hypothetical protein
MPVATIRLADGRLVKVKVPEGATQQQIGAYVQQNLPSISAQPAPQQAPQQQQMVRQNVRGGGSRMVPAAAEPDIFQGLTEEQKQVAIQNVPKTGRGLTRDQGELLRSAELERLRVTDPMLALQIEETGALEAALVGAGQGLTTIGRGLGIAAQPDETTRKIEQGLLGQSTAAQAGKFVAEALPSVAAGGGIGAVASLPARAALASGVGAAEGNILARGEGGDASQIATATALGGLLGLGAEVAVPVIKRAGLRKIKEISNGDVPDSVRQVVDDEGNITPEFNDYAQKNGIDIDEIVADEADISGIQSDTFQEIAEAGQESASDAAVGRVARRAQPSAAKVAAAEELGLDAPPSVLSDSREVQGLSGAFAALSPQQAKTLEDFSSSLGSRADDIIKEAGGDTNRIAISDTLKNKISSRIEDISTRESEAYSRVAEAIDPKLKVNTKKLIDSIEQKGEAVGGVKNLPAPTRKIYKTLRSKPTYGLLDQERRSIGEAIGKGKGSEVYRNASRSELDGLYAQLTEVQEGVAKTLGADELWDNAKAISRERFALQDQSKELFGKDLTDQLVPKVESAVKNITGKNYKQFKKLVDGIPEDERSAVVASAMSELFRGKGDQTFNATKYANFFADVTRNKIPTSIAKDMIDNFDRVDGLAGILYSAGEGAAKVPGGTVSGVAPLLRASSSLVEAASRKRTPSVLAADRLMGSKRLKDAIVAEAKNPGSSKARSIARSLENSEVYKSYIKSVDAPIAAQISEEGFINWLVSRSSSAQDKAVRSAQAIAPTTQQESDQ